MDCIPGGGSRGTAGGGSGTRAAGEGPSPGAQAADWGHKEMNSLYTFAERERVQFLDEQRCWLGIWATDAEEREAEWAQVTGPDTNFFSNYFTIYYLIFMQLVSILVGSPGNIRMTTPQNLPPPHNPIFLALSTKPIGALPLTRENVFLFLRSSPEDSHPNKTHAFQWGGGYLRKALPYGLAVEAWGVEPSLASKLQCVQPGLPSIDPRRYTTPAMEGFRRRMIARKNPEFLTFRFWSLVASFNTG